MILMIFIMSGCHQKRVTVNKYICPEFPEPKKEVLLSIMGIQNNETDKWVKELYIYKKKLEVIKENKGE